MAKGKLAFKANDVKRAVKAVRDAGLNIARVEIDNGKITVVPGSPADANNNMNPPSNGKEQNEWDVI